jgi:hypothetical protein
LVHFVWYLFHTYLTEYMHMLVAWLLHTSFFCLHLLCKFSDSYSFFPYDIFLNL